MSISYRGVLTQFCEVFDNMYRKTEVFTDIRAQVYAPVYVLVSIRLLVRALNEMFDSLSVFLEQGACVHWINLARQRWMHVDAAAF